MYFLDIFEMGKSIRS